MRFTDCDIKTDSRKIQPGDVFFALNGCFVDEALLRGASYVVVDKKNEDIVFGEKIIYVSDVRGELIDALQKKYRYNSDLYAITGSNGKSSIVNWFVQLCCDKKVACIGTLGVFKNYCDKTVTWADGMTTPDVADMHKIMYELGESGAQCVAFEASSHGLVQGRLDGLKICAAAFSSFSRDHLDYHKNIEEYLKAKLLLYQKYLDKNGCAIINKDVSEYVIDQINCKNKIIYGQSGDVSYKILEYRGKGCVIDLNIFGRRYDVELSFSLNWQIDNLVCSVILSMLQGEDIDKVTKKMCQILPLAGRMEFVCNFNGADIFVDYAHTPDGLEKTLCNLNYETKIIVFGCGGDRDVGKRYEMGRVVEKYADFAIITDDNPRFENADLIRRQIAEGCKNAVEIGNREDAIECALTKCKEKAVLIIAGKGSEKYQEINGVRHPFCDRDIVLKKIKKVSCDF